MMSKLFINKNTGKTAKKKKNQNKSLTNMGF